MSDITRNCSSKIFADTVQFGNLIFLRGVTANDKSGNLAEQTKECFAQIDEFLRQTGADKSCLLYVTIYMTDIRARHEVNAVWEAWVDPANLPARATVGVRELGTPDTLIEIVAVAGKKSS